MHSSSGKTVVFGASVKPERYSNKAILRLNEAGIDVVAIGLRRGEVDGITIEIDQPAVENVHTLTLYVGHKNFDPWVDYALSLRPQRIIINPGAENEKFEEEARNQGVEVIRACTLVMLATDSY